MEKLWKKILGTSDACSTSCLFHRPREPAYYIINCRISNPSRAALKTYDRSYTVDKILHLFRQNVWLIVWYSQQEGSIWNSMWDFALDLKFKFLLEQNYLQKKICIYIVLNHKYIEFFCNILVMFWNVLCPLRYKCNLSSSWYRRYHRHHRVIYNMHFIILHQRNN